MSELLSMNADHEHNITIKIADIESFKLPVPESAESFYRTVIEKINENVNRFRFGQNANPTTVALAKVALYYATMHYRRTYQMTMQAEMLKKFEERLDSLLESMD